MNAKKKKASKTGTQVDGKISKPLKESAFFRDGNSRASSSNSSSTDMMRYPQNNETLDIGGFPGREINSMEGGPQIGANQHEMGNNREYTRDHITPGMYQNNFNGSYPTRNSFVARSHDDGGRAMSNGGIYQPMLNVGSGKAGYGNLNNLAGPHSPYPGHMQGGTQRPMAGVGSGFMRPVPSAYGTPPLSSLSPGASMVGRYMDGGVAIDSRPVQQGFSAPLPTPMLNQLLQYSEDKQHHRTYTEEDYSSKGWVPDEHLRHKLHSNQIRNPYMSAHSQQSPQASPQANVYASSPLPPGQSYGSTPLLSSQSPLSSLPSGHAPNLTLNNNNTHTIVSGNSQPNAPYNKSFWPPSHSSALNEDDSPASEPMDVPPFQKPSFPSSAEAASSRMVAPPALSNCPKAIERIGKKKKVPTATLR